MTLINWLLVFVAIILLLYVTEFGTLIRKSVMLYLVIMFPHRKLHLPKWLSPKIEITNHKIKFGSRELIPKIFKLDDGKKHPGMIVFAPLAQEDEGAIAAINFLKGLAKAGFTVMVPLWPNRSLGTIKDTDPKDLAFSIDWFSRQEFIKGNAVGLIAVSYGAGPALIAAANKKIKEKLKYIVLLSGYVDLLSTTEAVVTGKFSYGKIQGEIDPDPYARYVLFHNAGKWCGSKHDQKVFNEMGKIILRQGGSNAKLKHFSKLLSTKGKEIFAWITALEPKDFRDKFAELPKKIKNYFRSLTPKFKNIFSIQKPLLIMHSTNDRLIPHTESIKLYNNINSYNKKSSLVLISAFDHAIPVQATFKNIWTIYIPNFFRIVRFIFQMLWLQIH